MPRIIRKTRLAFIIAGICFPACELGAQAAEKIDFATTIQPLFRAHCYPCHGPAVQNANFRLDRRQDSLPNRVGANGARIVPGDSSISRLYLKVTGQAGLRMPPTEPLSPEELATLKAWIDQGAEWPDELAGEMPSAPQDPQAAKMMDAVRGGNHAQFERLLKENPTAARGQGYGGSTPLMFAALYGDTRSISLLLRNGADPNKRNDAGATALLWAVDDPEATRLLLEHGADANIRSADGLTPLLLAVDRFGSGKVVNLLLDHGAKLEGDLLARAARAGDEAVMRTLMQRGAEFKPLPRDLALRSGCMACVNLVLPLAGRDDLNRGLLAAARFGDSAAIKMLLDRGAVANGEALRLAAASEKIPIEGVQALLAHGAADDAALGWAKRQGETPIVAALSTGGAHDIGSPANDAPQPARDRSAQAAVQKSLPVLQKADVVFFKKAGCISCHQNSLTELTIATARKNGFSVDEAIAESQLKKIQVYLESWRERVLQDIPIPGDLDTAGYILDGLAASNYAPDAATDALARFLKRRQAMDGGWRIAIQRPPLESSDFEASALAIRGLQVYAPKPQLAEYAKAIEKGAIWLAQAQPKTTEDHVYQLLGLSWSGANRQAIRKAAAELVALERQDGGWGQLPTLASDAYATGQALTALAEAAGLPVTDAIYRRGVRFLLSTQLADGSWHVATRTFPVQPYFDSEFPHERDQFISAAATNWATMALARAAKAE